MSPAALKRTSIACFVLCAMLLLVAWERYQANAAKIEAAKMLKSPPLGGMVFEMTREGNILAGTPAATTYSLVGALLAAVGGIVCFMVGENKPRSSIWTCVASCVLLAGIFPWSNIHRIWDLLAILASCIPAGYLLVVLFSAFRRKLSQETIWYGLLWGILISVVVATVLDIRRFVP